MIRLINRMLVWMSCLKLSVAVVKRLTTCILLTMVGSCSRLPAMADHVQACEYQRNKFKCAEQALLAYVILLRMYVFQPAELPFWQHLLSLYSGPSTTHLSMS
jgi:hypothetical protein